jgi:striatin 1/3/4
MERSDDVLQQQGNSLFNSATTNGDINYGSLINSNPPNINSLGGNNNNNNNLNNLNNGNNNGNNSGINNNSNNNNNQASGNGGDRAPASPYTMPGILHFLQHEWNRFEYERQQWDIDRAELMV